MKLTESHFYFVANYSVLSDIFEFSKRVVENFVHFMQLSGRVHSYVYKARHYTIKLILFYICHDVLL